MRLLLIRHAQTPANVLGQLDTARPGPGLTPLGERQAAQIPAALDGMTIGAIFASPLLRTQLTADPLASDKGLEMRVLEGLQEIEAGNLEMRSDRTSVHSYLETAFAWGTGDLDVRMPGGPDGHAFFERFDASIAAIAAIAEASAPDYGNENSTTRASGDERATAAVFSHGAGIRVWTARRTVNVPPEFAGAHELDNTGVVELSGSPSEGWTLLSWAGRPVGGAQFVDQQADDPTGEPL